MKYRPLGQTGLSVSEVGFGAWGVGGRTDGLTSYGDTDDDESRAAIGRALDVGINFFDTSNVYGAGHSEVLIGEVLGDRRSDVVIATKAGYSSYDAPPDYSPNAIRESLRESLGRLRCEYVDLLQLHNPTPAIIESAPEIGETLDALKREGLIRAHGVSVKSPEDGLAILASFRFDAVQANLNMMDIRLVDSGLLEMAISRRIGVIARTPLCFGFLSGTVSNETEFPEGDHRNLWSRPQIERWIYGAQLMRDAVPVPRGQSQTQVALRFCLSYPAISSVIPGILRPAEAEENAGASAAGGLLDDEMAAVQTINRENDFFVPAGG
jgi:aryl-alcohol dehydrogenase-like predicted oxidoreductase